MKKCKKCNNPLPDDAKFCNKCGSQIEYSEKWYEKFFNVYLRFIFFRFSIGSLACFIGVFAIGMVTSVALSELFHFNENAMLAVLNITWIVAVIVAIAVTKKVKNKQ